MPLLAWAMAAAEGTEGRHTSYAILGGTNQHVQCHAVQPTFRDYIHPYPGPSQSEIYEQEVSFRIHPYYWLQTGNPQDCIFAKFKVGSHPLGK